MIQLTVLDPGSGGGLCLHVRPSRNLPYSLLVNCPAGTQRIFNSTSLRMGTVADILFTHLSAVTLEGLPGLLLTRHNREDVPVGIRLVVPRRKNLSFFNELNSHGMSPFWGGQLQVVDAPIAVCGVPVVQNPECSVIAFSPLLGMPQSIGCAYLLEFGEGRRKMRKDLIKEYQLTALDCKRLCAGESVTVRLPSGSAGKEPVDRTEQTIHPDEIFYRQPCPGYVVILPPSGPQAVEEGTERVPPSAPSSEPLSISPLIQPSMFSRPSCCFMHVADFCVYQTLGWVSAYREANPQNKLFLYGTPTQPQLFRLCQRHLDETLTFDRACWDVGGLPGEGAPQISKPSEGADNLQCLVPAISSSRPAENEYDFASLPVDIQRELEETCVSLCTGGMGMPYRDCGVLRLLWSRGRDALSMAEVPNRLPPNTDAFISWVSHMHSLELTPEGVEAKVGFCSEVTPEEVQEYVKKKAIDEEALKTLSPISSTGETPDRNERAGPENALITLGTGASMPSKYRNVSSNLLRLGAFYYMVDAGEGTLNQICLMGNAAEANNIILRLRALFVTHSHADHYLGVLSVVRAKVLAYRFLVSRSGASPVGQTSTEAGDPEAGSSSGQAARLVPLDIYCSQFVKDYITYTFDMVTDVKLNSDIIAFHVLSDCDAGMTFFYNPGVLMRVFLAAHVPGSFGVVFADRNSRELYVFSGDSRPTPNLVGAIRDLREFCGDVPGARGSSYKVMLVHECTFGRESQEDAVEKGHSTVVEAYEQAVRCRADVLVLTHFSQRFCKAAPSLDADSRENAPAEQSTDQPAEERKRKADDADKADAVGGTGSADSISPRPYVVFSIDMLRISFNTARALADHSAVFYSLINGLD